MKVLLDFFTARSTTSLSRLMWMATVAGLSSTVVLYAINTAASYATKGDALGFLLAMFLAAELIFIYSQRYLFLTSLHEVEKVLHDYRQQQIERVRHCDLDTFERIGAARIFGGITRQTQIFSSAAPAIIMGAQFVVVVACALVYLAWLNVAAAMLTIVILGVGGYIYQSRMQTARAKLIENSLKENELFGSISDLIDGFKEIRLNALRSADFATHTAAISQQLRVRRGEVDVQLTDMFLFSHFIFFGTAAAVVFVLPGLGFVKSEELLKLVAVVIFLIGPIINVIGSAPAVANAGTSCDVLIDLDRRLSEAVREFRATPEQLRHFDKIELRGAVYRHGEDGAGFEVGPLDLTLNRGELLFVSGGNGSGKSTALKLLTALYLPPKGELLLDGEVVGPDRRGAYQSLFATIFSDFHLFERTFGLGDVADEEVAKWLAIMGLDGKTGLTNRRFDTLKLSTGQRKRLAFVVAVLEDRPIYVFDEFAADQDPSFRRKFYDEILPALRKRGKTVVVVTHDERYFDRASRHLVMEEGRLVHRGASDV